MKTKKIFLIMSLLTVSIILSACETGTRTANLSLPEPEPVEVYAPLGELQSLNDWEFTLNSVEAVSELPLSEGSPLSFQPREGNLFVVANMTVQYTGDFPQRFIPEVITAMTVNPTIRYGNRRPFSVVNLGRQNPQDISNYRLSSEEEPLTGLLVFEISQSAYDDKDAELIMSFAQHGNAVLYDLRELLR